MHMALLKKVFSSVLSEVVIKEGFHVSSISSLMEHEFQILSFKVLFIAHIVLKASLFHS